MKLRRSPALAGKRALDRQPLDPYQSCGLRLLISLRERMGKEPAPIGETLFIQC